MIKYKFEEELKYAIYYASKIEDKKTLELLKAGEVKTVTEAVLLSKFFWDMEMRH
ncbi:MAG: hypothetical protein ACI93R_003102 [Flavobacteriales bacterium]|jgi:hypothetical protein